MREFYITSKLIFKMSAILFCLAMFIFFANLASAFLYGEFTEIHKLFATASGNLIGIIISSVSLAYVLKFIGVKSVKVQTAFRENSALGYILNSEVKK